ncbi:hypothetical protein [Streptomyces sp. NRRL F-5135]|uniref:hypothetical protein n=1 Tax=Streptomyces sp. NRRL F-5135 TaxID=1463858 RepID=UPI000568B9D0|nr:hypothetical protein [Streptomyces sp. NRRL F-5135]
MKAYSFTTRNVTAGERNNADEMVLRAVGDVTVELVGMLPPELAEWEWATDALNTRGWHEEQFRLTMRGWKVVHPKAGTVGFLFQGAGTRVHVEWYDVVNGDYFPAGWTRNLRHGAAQIVNARQQAGQGLPADVEPEPYKAPTAPTRLRNGTPVRYHGTFAMTFSDIGISEFQVYGCDCDELSCRGYELHVPGLYEPVALHVGHDHVTALDPESVAARTIPTPDQVAELLLDPTVDDADAQADLTARLGARPARRLLAAAHTIAADRLWNAA